MTDLLLISDVPRLSEIFSRLIDDKKIRLRVATSLEKGGEELAAEKPGFVFVQTHLSGLSAEILLMHLKKQLGRKRTRFILLAPPEQTGDDTAKLYQGCIDTSLDDEILLESVRTLIASPKSRKVSPESAQPAAATAPEKEPLLDIQPPAPAAETAPATRPEQIDIAAVQAPSMDSPLEEPSLVEQGVTYAPRSRLSVYSEFNSSFDSAVNNTPPAEPLAHMPMVHDTSWQHEEIEVVTAETPRSKRATFLLWLAPVVIAVIVVTMLQHKRSKLSSVAIKPEAKLPVAASAVPPAAVTPVVPTPIAAPAVPTVAVAPPAPVAPAAAGPKPVAPAPAVTPAPPQSTAAVQDSKLGDKAVLSAIAESRGGKEKAGSRPTTLPDFIPRSGHDKSYSASNPGWERYKGQVTEFKVFREGGPIRAIQIIDRGGKGIPESFMRGVLSQVGSKSPFAKDISEKKDGYEIQRGRVSDNLSVVMYRDEQGGRLRAFVLTWQ